VSQKPARHGVWWLLEPRRWMGGITHLIVPGVGERAKRVPCGLVMPLTGSWSYLLTDWPGWFHSCRHIGRIVGIASRLAGGVSESPRFRNGTLMTIRLLSSSPRQRPDREPVTPLITPYRLEQLHPEPRHFRPSRSPSRTRRAFGSCPPSLAPLAGEPGGR